MPTYVYRCEACNAEDEQDFPIGTARSLMSCECGSMMRRVLGVGVHIGAGALPTKKGELATADARDRELSGDLAAYKRMRERGLQPRGITNAQAVENSVEDQMDIDHARAYTLDPNRSRDGVRDAIKEGYEAAAQIRAEADA